MDLSTRRRDSLAADTTGNAVGAGWMRRCSAEQSLGDEMAFFGRRRYRKDS